MTPEELELRNAILTQQQLAMNRPAPEKASPAAADDALESLRAALDVRSKPDILATAHDILGRIVTDYGTLSQRQRRDAVDITAAFLADLRASGINGEGPGAVSAGPFNAIRPTSHER